MPSSHLLNTKITLGFTKRANGAQGNTLKKSYRMVVEGIPNYCITLVYVSVLYYYIYLCSFKIFFCSIGKRKLSGIINYHNNNIYALIQQRILSMHTIISGLNYIKVFSSR